MPKLMGTMKFIVRGKSTHCIPSNEWPNSTSESSSTKEEEMAGYKARAEINKTETKTQRINETKNCLRKSTG